MYVVNVYKYIVCNVLFAEGIFLVQLQQLILKNAKMTVMYSKLR